MKEFWVSLTDLPEQGADFILEDARLWEAPAEEFRLDFRMSAPLRAELHVAPLHGAFLVRGRLCGTIFAPCGRCAEEAELRLDEDFEHFLRPSSDDEDEAGEAPEDFEEERHVRLSQGGAPEADLAGLCVEEFLLALPVKILCRSDCKGLCPVCGANLNSAPCACGEEAEDPRLAVLRDMKISRP